jgi:hypothetical protein
VFSGWRASASGSRYAQDNVVPISRWRRNLRSSDLAIGNNQKAGALLPFFFVMPIIEAKSTTAFAQTGAYGDKVAAGFSIAGNGRPCQIFRSMFFLFAFLPAASSLLLA